MSANMKNISKPEAEKLGWKLQSTAWVFQSPWYDLRQDRLILPQQTNITYTYIEHPGAVFIVPMTANDEIILIHSYRYTIDAWCWEIPAGNIGDQAEQEPESVARQELEEEIGGRCQSLDFLGKFYLANGFGNIQGCFFLANGVEITRPQDLEPTEIIDEIAILPIQQVKQMIHNREINDADSAFAIFLALSHLEQNQSK